MNNKYIYCRVDVVVCFSLFDTLFMLFNIHKNIDQTQFWLHDILYENTMYLNVFNKGFSTKKNINIKTYKNKKKKKKKKKTMKRKRINKKFLWQIIVRDKNLFFDMFRRKLEN